MGVQRLFHQILGAVAVILVVSGVLMHSESLRGPLADFRFVLRGLHRQGGVLFILLFFANVPYFLTFRQGKQEWVNRRGYLWLLAIVGVCWTIFGGGLLGSLMLGWTGPYSSWLYEAHLMSAGIGALIVLPHLLHPLVKRARIRDPVDGQQQEVLSGSSRRSFLRYVIGGVVFVGIGAAWKWLNQFAATVKTETTDIFAQCNKMTPAPQPLPESLPPKGGGYTGKFKVYKIDPQIPCATSADWRFTVSGLVDKPQSFGWDDFLKLPRVVQVSDFHCVEGWSVYRITYEGVKLSDLFERVGVSPQAKYVKFLSAEKIYTDSLSLEQARLPDVMAAVLLDGKAIPSDLGGPLRLVMPQMFAYKAVKWLTGMEFIDSPHKGYWEVRGYPADAWIKPVKKG